MPKTLNVLAIALFAGLSATACTASTNTAASAPTNLGEIKVEATADNKVDTSVFRGVDYDSVVFNSPEELGRHNRITDVFAAEVKGFSQGRVVSSPELDERHVVMTVSLSENLKGDPGAGGLSYVDLPQPLCAGNVPCSTVEDFSKAIPVGTKVMVFGTPSSEAAPAGARIVNTNAGRPAGARLVQPIPQGLLFESVTAGKTTVVGAYEKVDEMSNEWRKDLPAGIDGFRARLRAAKLNQR